MPERIPIVLSRPEPGETKEEFKKRFAREVFEGIKAARAAQQSQEPTGPTQ